MSYSHLSLAERKKIREYLDSEYCVAEIARFLSRDPKTIQRELKRNCNPETGEYNPNKAQERFETRKENWAVSVAQRETKRTKELLDYLQARLDEGWTPMQIEQQKDFIISYRTIYYYIRKGYLKRNKKKN